MKSAGLIILMCLLIFASAQAEIGQDNGGDWRINTFENDDEYPHLVCVYSFSAFDGEGLSKPIPAGMADSDECISDIVGNWEAADKKARIMIAKIITFTQGKYVIGLSISICHPQWFVIYLHDGNEVAGKEVYVNIAKIL